MKKHQAKQMFKMLLLIIMSFMFISSSLTSASTLGNISGHFFDKRRINKWNQANLDKITDNFSIWFGTYEKPELRGHVGCDLWGSLTNNSKEYISYVVVEIKIFNKSTNTIVAEKKETFEVSVVPTAKKSIVVFFENNLFNEAYKQLGDNFSYNCELIGCVPQSMVYGTCGSGDGDCLSGPDYNWLE